MRAWHRVVFAVLAATFPATDRLPGLDRERTLSFLSTFTREVPISMRAVLYASVLVFLVTPLVTVRRPVPALLLGRETLDRHADRLSRHRSYFLRQTMKMLKTVGGLVWGSDPDVRRTLGMRAYGQDPGTWRET